MPTLPSLLRKTLAVTGWGSFGTSLGYVLWTRQSKILPIPPHDYLFANTVLARLNPNNAAVTQDVCVRRVPLGRVRAELLAKEEGGEAEAQEGRLVREFCRGVWGGLGFAYQRRFLEKKYRGPETASQLWDRADLLSSDYSVGTQITDHFEVVSKTPNSIIVRCGDSPRKMEVRNSDGLFEMVVDVKRDEGVVEFGLKSVFFNGLGEAAKEGEGGPMGPWIQWAHQQYDKVLMETAITKCMK